MKSLSIIGMSILAWVIYGIVHDHITARLAKAILGSRIAADFDEHEFWETVGSTMSIAMIGWDDNKRAYRIVRAISNGRSNEASGQWNDAIRSLVWNWKMPDYSEVVTAIATWRLVGKGAIQIHVVHEKENDVLLDLTIKMKRRE